jgi:hypothetical protein
MSSLRYADRSEAPARSQLDANTATNTSLSAYILHSIYVCMMYMIAQVTIVHAMYVINQILALTSRYVYIYI